MRVLRVVSLFLVCLAAGPAASAQAAASKPATRVLDDYRVDGRIDPCRHSEADLRETKRQIPPDVEQYAPDFRAAVDGALEARARGECDREADGNPSSSPVGAATAAPRTRSGALPGATVQDPSTSAAIPPPAPGASAGTPGATSVAEPPAPAVAPRAPARTGDAEEIATRAAVTDPINSAPAPVLALAILSGLLALTALLLLAAGRTSWGEHHLPGARHAWGEAAWRSSGAWQDFVDWVRLGR